MSDHTVLAAAACLDPRIYELIQPSPLLIRPNWLTTPLHQAIWASGLGEVSYFVPLPVMLPSRLRKRVIRTIGFFDQTAHLVRNWSDSEMPRLVREADTHVRIAYCLGISGLPLGQITPHRVRQLATMANRVTGPVNWFAASCERLLERTDISKRLRTILLRACPELAASGHVTAGEALEALNLNRQRPRRKTGLVESIAANPNLSSDEAVGALNRIDFKKGDYFTGRGMSVLVNAKGADDQVIDAAVLAILRYSDHVWNADAQEALRELVSSPAFEREHYEAVRSGLSRNGRLPAALAAWRDAPENDVLACARSRSSARDTSSFYELQNENLSNDTQLRLIESQKEAVHSDPTWALSRVSNLSEAVVGLLAETYLKSGNTKGLCALLTTTNIDGKAVANLIHKNIAALRFSVRHSAIGAMLTAVAVEQPEIWDALKFQRHNLLLSERIAIAGHIVAPLEALKEVATNNRSLPVAITLAINPATPNSVRVRALAMIRKKQSALVTFLDSHSRSFTRRRAQ